MLETIKDFFLTFGEVFMSITNFLIGLIEDIVYIVKLVGTLVLNIPYYFSWLPESILVLVVGIFAIVVIYKVLGREG